MNRFFKNSLLVIVSVVSLATGTVYAQDVYVDSAKVRITAGAFLVNTRNVVVVDSGLINNSGTVFVSGNITNTNGRVSSNGLEVLNGTSDQTITGVHGTSNLGNVIRSQSANTNIIAGSNLAMRNFDFGSTNGFFRSIVLDRTIRILNSADTAIKNFSPTKYFDLGDNLGVFARAVNLDTFPFPIGNSVAGYRRLDFILTSLGSTGTDYISTKVITGYSDSTITFGKSYASGFDNSAGICFLGTRAQEVIFDCLTQHFWNSSGPADYRYKVLAYSGTCADMGGGVGPRRVVKSPAGTGLWTTNVENVVGTVTANLCLHTDWTTSANPIPGGIYQGFGDLAVAGGLLYPLSVEFTSLTAIAGESEIVLNWETASENNADRFEVLRSTDAVNFEKIGSIYAFGNSNTPREYQFIDENVEPDVEYYYQLRQVDYNEQFTLSNVVSTRISGSSLDNSELLVYPNPTSGLLKISQVVDQVVIVNTVGQQVGYYQNVNTIPLDDLPAGMYILQVKNQNGNKNFKVQKQ